MAVSLVETQERTPKSVTRETAVRVQPGNRLLLMTLLAGGKMVEFRPKGTRQRYRVSIEQCWQLAVQNRAAEDKECRR